jgi:predicted RND superfamily exporter protein
MWGSLIRPFYHFRGAAPAARRDRFFLKSRHGNALFQKILRAFRADVAVPVLADFITARPRALAAATLAIGLLLAAGAAGIRARHTVDDFFIDDTDNGRFLTAFRERFPNGEFFVVAYDDPALFTADGVNRLKTLTRALADLPEVKEVKSLANVTDIRGEDDAFIVRPFLHEVPTDPAGLARLRARATGHRLYEKQFVSPDGRTAAIVVFVQDPPPDEGYRRRTLAAVKGVLDRHRSMGPFDLAGWTVTNVSVVEYMMKDFQRYIPLTFLLVGVVSWFVFRNPRLIGLALANVALTLGATLGLSRAAGFSLNVISSIAVPLIMSLALTDTVHVFTHLDRRLLARHTPAGALNAALREILRPSFVTSLNTALGFFSLTFSRTPAIREFGWMGAAGMGLEFLFTFGFLAPAVLFFRPEKRVPRGRHRERQPPRGGIFGVGQPRGATVPGPDPVPRGVGLRPVGLVGAGPHRGIGPVGLFPGKRQTDPGRASGGRQTGRGGACWRFPCGGRRVPLRTRRPWCSWTACSGSWPANPGWTSPSPWRTSSKK